MIYIFDIDKTLADNKKREKILSEERKAANNLKVPWSARKKAKSKVWVDFEHELAKDDAATPVVEIMISLAKNRDNKVYILTTRSEYVRKKTAKWLNLHTGLKFDEKNLFMRKKEDKRPESEVKVEMVKAIPDLFLSSCPPVVFDDKDYCIEEFEKLGLITCKVNLYTGPLQDGRFEEKRIPRRIARAGTPFKNKKPSPAVVVYRKKQTQA